MDAMDRKILAELQTNGRLTVTELADRVRLSVSPCQRRLRRLESTESSAATGPSSTQPRSASTLRCSST
jgi:DeoR/GlpR family transcriptional regulator of sugar metabolism